MKLIAFEFSSFENRGLDGDVFPDCMGQVVINSVGTLEDVLESVFIL